MLRNILSALIALVVAFFVVGYLLPKSFRVERTVEIDAPVARVFDQVVDLKKNEAWNPWVKADPTMKLTYAATSSGTGASYSWTSENSGEGTLTTKAVEPLKRIENALDFGDMGTATGFWVFEADGDDKTQVTWGLFGEQKGPIGAYFALLMDRMVGPDFEQGLTNLKAVSEGE